MKNIIDVKEFIVKRLEEINKETDKIVNLKQEKGITTDFDIFNDAMLFGKFEGMIEVYDFIEEGETNE